MNAEVFAAQNGDTQAFARLVDAYRNVVCSITLAILRDVEQSEDVAQDVFVAAWTSVGKLRNTSSFLPWLRQLARNHAHQALRSKVRFKKRHSAWETDAESVADQSASAAGRLIHEEERRALASAIEELPDETRELVTLFYREGRSVAHVGQLLGLSEEAVKKRLERVRATLRDAVLERFESSVKRTAPGAAFTLAVTALIVAAPGTAAAATTVTGALFKAAGATTKTTLMGVATGALIGFGGALGAILFGLVRLRRLARSDEERRALRTFGAVNLSLVGATFVLWELAMRFFPGEGALLAPWIAYALAISASYQLWLPRIIASRLELERLEDPTAAARQRKERLRSVIGNGLGLLLGLACVLLHLFRH